ncbi:unnamed protein product [Larinioides sclopetarius]|uniref:Uncharacterized protein n=1 Tax=Larinioides sclopetarius TaxID=280406 RepID=A0AAV2AMS4_9ARAC
MYDQCCWILGMGYIWSDAAASWEWVMYDQCCWILGMGYVWSDAAASWEWVMYGITEFETLDRTDPNRS